MSFSHTEGDWGRLYHGDCLEVMKSLPDQSIDAVVTDPPYDLTSGNRRIGFQHCLRWIMLKIQLPQLNDPDAFLGEILDFTPISSDGLLLDAGEGNWVDAGIGMPEGAVDFKGDGAIREPEINDAGESAVGAVERMLADELSPHIAQADGDLILKLRCDTGLAFCQGPCGCYRQLSPSLFRLDVIVSASAFEDRLGCPTPPAIVGRGRDVIGVIDDPATESQTPPRVMASTGAEMHSVLTLDLTRRAYHLGPADRTGEPRFTLQQASAQDIGTLTRASGLPSVQEAAEAGRVNDAADRALPGRRLFIHCDVISFLSKSIPKSGFMNKDWDGTGIAFSEDFWREIFRILKPGSHVLSFGGTRTYHRMASAIEDAGFRVEDSLHWIYGQGFPKHKSKLKPAHEPIILATKPGGEKWLNVDGCRVVGPAGDGHWTYKREIGGQGIYGGGGRLEIDMGSQGHPSGRYPPNLVFTHHPLCDLCGTRRVKSNGRPNLAGKVYTGSSPNPMNRASGSLDAKPHTPIGDPDGTEVVPAWNCVEGLCPIRELDRQSGERKSGLLTPEHRRHTAKGWSGAYADDHDGPAARGTFGGDSGGASRFFPQFSWQADDFAPFLYCPKASKKDRGENNIHPCVKPQMLMRWLCRLSCRPGGTILDPFAGSGTTLRAARSEGFSAIGIESDPDYYALAARLLRGDELPLFG
jgi:DNA modification methylase